MAYKFATTYPRAAAMLKKMRSVAIGGILGFGALFGGSKTIEAHSQKQLEIAQKMLESSIVGHELTPEENKFVKSYSKEKQDIQALKDFRTQAESILEAHLIKGTPLDQKFINVLEGMDQEASTLMKLTGHNFQNVLQHHIGTTDPNALKEVEAAKLMFEASLAERGAVNDVLEHGLKSLQEQGNVKPATTNKFKDMCKKAGVGVLKGGKYTVKLLGKGAGKGIKILGKGVDFTINEPGKIMMKFGSWLEQKSGPAVDKIAK